MAYPLRVMKGIDVSHWQGTNFDFNDAKFDGYDFVIIKAGGSDALNHHSMYTDGMFETNYRRAKDAGMHIGAYWYTAANSVSEAMQDAQYFYQNCLAGKEFDMPIYIDVEDKRTFAAGCRITTDVIKAFCGYLEQKGYWVGIYASLSYFSSRMYDDELLRYTHWVAQYNGGYGCTYPNKDILGMWQYSSSEYVSGTRTDTNICYVDFPTEIRKAERNGLHVHTWKYVADQTNHCFECTKCGERKGAEPHTLKPMHDATHHFEQCTVCGANVHWEKHYGGSADCAHKAICSACGAEYGETDPDKHIGETKIVGAVPATNEHNGWTGNEVCAGCGKVFKGGTVIPKKEEIPGDVNGDGQVDTRDLVRLMKGVASGETDPKYDVNGDGNVDTKDIINLMKKLSEGNKNDK